MKQKITLTEVGTIPPEIGGGYERINRVYSPSGTAFTLAATDVYNPSILEVEPVKDVVCIRLNKIDENGNKRRVRIRKLTPRECWRLMDFDDADFDKAAKVNSNTQLYKQAGNSIVVSCLEEIIREML